jgi:hypothetical protein
VYLDSALLHSLNLIVPVWTMGAAAFAPNFFQWTIGPQETVRRAG